MIPGNKLVQIMQQAARAPLSDSTDMLFGKVISTNPLKVRVDNRFELTHKFLITTSLVSDFSVDMEVDGQTKRTTVRLGLTAGESVILLRVQGGQKFIIIDRVR